MKSVIIALAVVLVLVGGVVGNACFVHHAAGELEAGLSALPAHPDPATTPAQVAALRRDFSACAPWLGVSISTTVLDRVGESLAMLESYARAGDDVQYAATLSLLQELARELARLEQIAPENIL